MVVCLLCLVRFDSISIPFLVLSPSSHGPDESETILLSDGPAHLHAWIKRERDRAALKLTRRSFDRSLVAFLRIYVVSVGLSFIRRRYRRGLFSLSLFFNAFTQLFFFWFGLVS